jgi:hypothetical protein
VIAEPNSSTTPEPSADTASETESDRASLLARGFLSAEELYRLTLYKWRYSLEAYGFSPEQVRKLMFLKWLHASHRVQG